MILQIRDKDDTIDKIVAKAAGDARDTETRHYPWTVADEDRL